MDSLDFLDDDDLQFLKESLLQEWTERTGVEVRMYDPLDEELERTIEAGFNPATTMSLGNISDLDTAILIEEVLTSHGIRAMQVYEPGKTYMDFVPSIVLDLSTASIDSFHALPSVAELRNLQLVGYAAALINIFKEAAIQTTPISANSEHAQEGQVGLRFITEHAASVIHELLEQIGLRVTARSDREVTGEGTNAKRNLYITPTLDIRRRIESLRSVLGNDSKQQNSIS